MNSYVSKLARALVADFIAAVSSLEEREIDIGAVDRRVAHGASLVFLRLVMSRTDRAQRWRRVTLQAEQVDLAHAQHARVG